MHNLQLYLTLIRFDKPIGRILLAWPCLWGIAHSYHTAGASFSSCLACGCLLSVGAFLLSGFGCIINDMADRDFDRQVERTKTRPLAAGTLSLKQAIICASILAALSLVVFLMIPPIARLYAACGAVLLFIYPFMKRITYYPQIVLGLAFNTGVLVGYACLSGAPTAGVWYLYACGVCWTIAYDTIYAFQDITDDEQIGIKSSAIRFKQHPKLMVGVCYGLGFMFLCLCKGGASMSAFLYAVFALYTLVRWDPKDTQSCGKYFKAHALFSMFGLVYQ
ncbi:MAG: 4-hydroxybenzoate octaprenyltransferase [Pseudomonadota bacterium]